MKIGQNKVNDNYQKRTRVTDMKDGEQFAFRIINGPFTRNFHLYPSIYEDSTTKELKPGWTTIYVKGGKDVEENLLDKFAKLDLLLKQNRLKATNAKEDDIKKAKSMVRKNNRFDYAIIKRVMGEQPTISILEAPWGVFNQIKNLINTKSTKDQSKLAYGLQYMFDFILKRTKNTKTGYPEYTVSVDITSCSKCAEKIDAYYLDTEKNPYPNNEQFFTPEEMDAINSCKFEMEEIDTPKTNEEVAEILKKNPLDIGRRDKNSQAFYFFNTAMELQALVNTATNIGLNYYVPNSPDIMGLPNPTPNAPALPEATNSVQADYSVVDDVVQPVPENQTVPSATVPADLPLGAKVPPTFPNQQMQQPTPAPVLNTAAPVQQPVQQPVQTGVKKERPKW